MKKSVFLPVKKLTVALTVILAGFMSTGLLQAQTGASITAFNFTLNPNYSATINANTIIVPVYNTADITTLVATFTLSPFATVRVGGVLQTSGLGAKDYTSGVTFVVTSGDGLTTKSYLVTVTKNPPLTEKQLLTFSFAGITGAVGVINQTDFTVQVNVPFSQVVTNLKATFTSSPVSKVYIGTALQTSGVTANDFSSTVVYKVVAENTSVRNYYITVTKSAARIEKQITLFEFNTLTPHISGVINETNHTIGLTVPFATNLTGLVAHFEISPLSTVKVGSVVQKSDTTANNFTNPVTYTVVAENSGTQDYVVTVTKALASNAKDITSFSFAGLIPPVSGVIVGTNITLTVPYATSLTALVATFALSPLSTVNVNSVPQISGSTANDFTTDKVYQVVAEDGSVKNYTVHVAVFPPLAEKSILTFNFLALDPDVLGVINENAKTITLTVPYATNVTSLVPTFTSSPLSAVLVAGVSQASGITAQNFTGPVAYTCQAQDGTTAVYMVTVNKVPANTANSMLTFNFEVGFNPIVTGVISQVNKTITLTVPYSTVLTALKATFTSSPLSTVSLDGIPQVSGVTENDFTTARQYKCTAEDGSWEYYSVTVIKGPIHTGTRILTFNFEVGFNPIIIGVISGDTIRLIVPFSTVLDSLKATFTSSPYSTLSVNNVPQISGVTKNNYSGVVEYKCTAEDGSFDYYYITVARAAVQTGREIAEFRFNTLIPNVIGVINQTNRTIALSVPFSTDLTNLVATFTASPMATLKLGLVVQTSGVTSNNYTNPVVFTVTAENGVSQNYTVTVTRLILSTAKDILEFRFNTLVPNVLGVINQNAKTITVSVPYLTPLTALVATFTKSPLSMVRVGSTVQVSGTTANDFTNPVLYTVTAEDGTIATYTVTVSIYVIPKTFLTFSIGSYFLIGGDTVRYTSNGIINDLTHTVQVNIPFSAPKNNLAASFTLTANTSAYVGTILQVSGVTLNDFTSTRSFILTATDGSSVEYRVTVNNNPVDLLKQISFFGFNGLSPAVQGVISESNKTISVLLPFGTTRNGLVATFTTTSGLTRVKVNNVIQKSGITVHDFSNPLIYRCIDEAGNYSEYTVTVTVAAGSSAKDITYFAFEDLNPDVIGDINQSNRTITAIVPNGTNRANLRAFYTNSPLSMVRVLGASGGIQQSGLTVNDFRTPLVYEVTAQDGSTKSYSVTVGETADTTKPVVSNTVQSVTNLPGQYVLVQSNEGTGKVFIIRSNVVQTTIAQLEAAVSAGFGRSAFVVTANTDIAISTSYLPEGTYYAYAIDGTGNMSLRGSNNITVIDLLPPSVFVAAQTKSNYLYNFVNVQSSKSNSMVYLVLEGVPQLTKLDFDAAVTVKKAVRGLVMYANVDVPLSIYGLIPGNYHAYAIDIPAGNISAPSSNVVVITEASRSKSILTFSFNELTPPATGQIIGTDISVKLRVGTPVDALVASFDLSLLSHAYVGLIQQVSGITPNDFTDPVIYRVTAEDGSSIDYTVTVSFNTGVDESEWLNSIKSFPNPVSDKLTIETTRPIDRIQIINGLGQTIEDIHKPGQTFIEIQTGAWMKGIYFVRYYNKERYIGVQKIIKN